MNPLHAQKGLTRNQTSLLGQTNPQSANTHQQQLHHVRQQLDNHLTRITELQELMSQEEIQLMACMKLADQLEAEITTTD